MEPNTQPASNTQNFMLPPATHTYNSNTNNINLSGLMAITNDPDQLPWVIRAIWYLTFGWSLLALWLCVAYFFAITIIGVPLAQWMLLRGPTVLTLQRQRSRQR